MRLPFWIRVRLDTRRQVRTLRTEYAHRIALRESKPRLSIHVSHHALMQAQERYGDDIAAFDILEDVVAAMRARRTGDRAPGGYTVKGARDFLAWTETMDRLYVVKRSPMGLVVITSLPPSDDRWRTRLEQRTLHRNGVPAVGRALAEAQERAR